MYTHIYIYVCVYAYVQKCTNAPADSLVLKEGSTRGVIRVQEIMNHVFGQLAHYCNVHHIFPLYCSELQ